MENQHIDLSLLSPTEREDLALREYARNFWFNHPTAIRTKVVTLLPVIMTDPVQINLPRTYAPVGGWPQNGDD